MKNIIILSAMLFFLSCQNEQVHQINSEFSPWDDVDSNPSEGEGEGETVTGEGEGEVLSGEGEGETETVFLQPIEIFRNGQEQWVLDFMQEAIDVWAQHNFPFVLSDNPDALIRADSVTTSGQIAGVFTSGLYHQIYVINSEYMRYELNQSCVLAAELGRIVNIPVNSGHGGLMGVTVPLVSKDTPCPWNNEDQQSLCMYDSRFCE